MTSTRSLVRRCCTLVAAAMIAAAAAPASAVLVGADFDGSTPTNWTPVTSGTVNNLIDETGAPTAVDINVGGNFGVGQGLNAGTIPTHSNPLTNLSGFNTSPTLITLSDLVPNAVYKFWLFSVYDNFAGGNGDFDAHALGQAPEQTFSFPGGNIGDLFINGALGSSANTLDSYAALVTASATGTIVVRFSGSSSGEVPVSGVAIELVDTAIPTPSAAAGALGLLALAATRRRRTA